MDTNNHSTDALEGKLLSRFGTGRPFSVPEGYFENLPCKVMERITRRRRRQSVWRWVAAVVLMACVTTSGVLFEHNYRIQTAEAEDIQYIEDALDYSMIDNLSIASYLTEAE